MNSGLPERAKNSADSQRIKPTPSFPRLIFPITPPLRGSRQDEGASPKSRRWGEQRKRLPRPAAWENRKDRLPPASPSAIPVPHSAIPAQAPCYHGWRRDEPEEREPTMNMFTLTAISALAVALAVSCAWLAWRWMEAKLKAARAGEREAALTDTLRERESRTGALEEKLQTTEE